MPYDPKADFYVLLEIPDTATEAAIKAAYRRLMHVAHPDKGKGSDGARAVALSEAKRVLCDPSLRAKYDGERRVYLLLQLRPAFKAIRPARRQPRMKTRSRANKTPVPVAQPRQRSAIEVATDNVVASLESREYGKALVWFLAGLAMDQVRKPKRAPGR